MVSSVSSSERVKIKTFFFTVTGQPEVIISPELFDEVVEYFVFNPDPKRCKTDLARIFAKHEVLPKQQQPPAKRPPRRCLPRNNNQQHPSFNKSSSDVSQQCQPSTSRGITRSTKPPPRKSSSRESAVSNAGPQCTTSAKRTLAPKVVASKLKTNIRPGHQAAKNSRAPPTSAPADPIECILPTSELPESAEEIVAPAPIVRPTRLIEPFNFVEGEAIPSDIVERDILFVALKLASMNREDLPISMNNLTSLILKVARNFKLGTSTKKVTLRAIGQIFYSLSCVPVDFLNTFTYHPNNSFFDEIEFTDPTVNHALRTSALYSRGMDPCCADNSLGSRQIAASAAVMDEYIGLFDNNLMEIAEGIAIISRKGYKSKSVQQLLGKKFMATIGGAEPASGCVAGTSGAMLAVPVALNHLVKSSVLTTDERREYLKDGIVPRTDIAINVILEEIKLIEERLSKQVGEGKDHLDQSFIFNNGLRYVLQPSALMRQNLWQIRGSDQPGWFPGFYTVFQDSYKLEPTIQKSPSETLLHAWRSLAPSVDLN